jgi:hypothetical protein
MSPGNFVQADLRFLLPIQAKQQVAIWGHIPALIEAITDTGAACTVLLSAGHRAAAENELAGKQIILHGRSLPMASATVDHFFMLQLGMREATWLLDEIKRVLKPGGWLFLGVRNRFSLHQLGIKPQAQHTFTLSQLQALFSDREWTIEACYGVHEDLQTPQYLISLAGSETAAYFYDQVFIPHSQSGAWAQRLALHLSKMGGQRFLFKDLALVAQRL